MWSRLRLTVRALLKPGQLDEELQEELDFHVAMQARKNVDRSRDPEEALRRARIEFGSMSRAAEECRDERGSAPFEALGRDVRFGMRVLRKAPSFTFVAVMTLAMGIGANVVVFGVLNGLLLRPLNVPRAETLYGTQYGEDPGFQSYANYLDLRDRNRSFESLAAFNFAFVGLDTGGDPAVASGFAASGNYFDVLGITPHLGRFFHAGDEHGPNSAPYIVLSYRYWHGRFADDPNVVGRTVLLNKHPFSIIGVAPAGFDGTLLFVTPDFFIPIVNEDELGDGHLMDARGSLHQVFETFGHLKAGVTPAQAVADVTAVGDDLARAYPKEFVQRKAVIGRTGLTSFEQPVRKFLMGLMLFAGLILLAACANLGTLFAARAADRSREVALRLALGSSALRVVRQLLTEAGLLSLLGGAIGLGGSVVLLSALSEWNPFPGANFRIPANPDARIYAVSLGLAVLSGLLFGIVPVRQVLTTDPYKVLKAGSWQTLGRRIAIRDLLLGVEIAICAFLVTSSMVAVRGLVRSLNSDLGFDPRGVVVVGTNLSIAGYSGEGVPAMQKRMVSAAEAIPGVDAVGLVNNYPPLVYAAATRASVFRDDAADLRPTSAAASPFRYEISPEYFRSSATALLAGRAFSWGDDQAAPRVAVVNREFARSIFGSVERAVLGYYKLQDGTRVQVVGVVEDGKYLNLTEDREAAMFVPFLQSPSSACQLIVRSARDTQDVVAALRTTLHGLDPSLPVNIDTWSNLLSVVLFPARVATVALGVLGALAALLSITGLFGMAAYSVTKRKREIGIRMALGAQRREMLEAAIGRALKVLTIGSASGLLLGVLASRILAAIVYQASPRDPVVLVTVVLGMVLVGLLATWIPARRALGVEARILLHED
jgi:predicted permease